jgi:hypothetical protein
MMEHKRGDLQTMLKELQDDPTKGARIQFHAMGWAVYMNAEGPGMFRARLKDTSGKLLVDETLTYQALGTYIGATITLDERRMVILSAMAVAEAEKLLAS